MVTVYCEQIWYICVIYIYKLCSDISNTKYFSQFPGDHDVTSEQVEEPAQPTPHPIVQRTPAKRHTLDNAHYDALVAKKAKFEAETVKLREEAAMMRAKTQVLDLKRQLLEIELFKRRSAVESQE